MINNKILPFLIAALFFLFNPAVANDMDWPKIDLLAVNPDEFITETVKIKKDPVYQKDKEYKGFLLSQVLKKFKYPESYQDADLLLVFKAQDGYKVSMSLADARQKKGYIAYQDNATSPPDKWDSFKSGKQIMTPAPFYLIWPEKVDKLRYPWPYQLISIELQPVSSYYDAAAPKQQTEAINKGFQLFSTYCIRCHSINLIGGNVGPELNIPKNVTEYFMASELPGFIRNAPSYQAGTKMPVFEDVINEQQAQQIIQYLQQKKSEKIQ